jgi:hypothetical protein
MPFSHLLLSIILRLLIDVNSFLNLCNYYRNR